MKIITNEPLINRNRRIAQITMMAGLLVLAGGMFISFRMPDQFGLSLVALLLGFLLSQVGIYFSNRWGRRPRPDEQINQSLKGLDNKYAIYHYQTPASHLLIGPAGLWIILPKHQRGTITYENGRWKQKGGGLLMGYLKIFAQEGLGRPDVDVVNEIEGLEKFFGKLLPDDEIPAIQPALVFTHPDVDIQIDPDTELPAPTIPIAKLKDLIRKSAKSKPITTTKVDEIKDLLPE